MVGIHRRDPAGHLNDPVADPVAAIVLAGGARPAARRGRQGRSGCRRPDPAGAGAGCRVRGADGGRGPARPLPAGVFGVCENPAGGGPAAGLVAGFGRAGGTSRRPSPRRRATHRRAAQRRDPLAGADPGVGGGPPGCQPCHLLAAGRRAAPAGLRGAVLVSAGRRQYGVGVYSADALRWSIVPTSVVARRRPAILARLDRGRRGGCHRVRGRGRRQPEDLARWRSRRLARRLTAAP